LKTQEGKKSIIPVSWIGKRNISLKFRKAKKNSPHNRPPNKLFTLKQQNPQTKTQKHD